MSHIEKIKKTGKEIKKEVNKKLITYITAGFGLVAGLAWNDAIKSLIEYFFPTTQNTMVAKFIYALAFTVFLAFITFYLNRLLNKEEAEEKTTLIKK